MSFNRIKNRRKQVAALNILVIGRPNVGKTTFIRTLVASIERQQNMSRTSTATSNTYPPTPTGIDAFDGVDLQSPTSIIMEGPGGRRLHVTFLDTPGVSSMPEVAQIAACAVRSFEKSLSEELKVCRDARAAYSSLIHAAIYLLPARPVPSSATFSAAGSEWEREVRFDVDAMRQLSQYVNVIPVMSRTDTLTKREYDGLRRRLIGMCDFTTFSTPFYEDESQENSTSCMRLHERVSLQFPFSIFGAESDESRFTPIHGRDERGQNHRQELPMPLPQPQTARETATLPLPKGMTRHSTDKAANQRNNQQFAEKLPMSPLYDNSDSDHKEEQDVGGKGAEETRKRPEQTKIIGRIYPWGVLDVDKFSDLPELRNLLFDHGAEHLIEYTREVLYENFRSSRLTMKRTGAKPALVTEGAAKLVREQGAYN